MTPVLYQAERAECGLVALAMVAGHHGLHFDLTSLRARYPVSSKGATLNAIIAVAKDLKLETRALRCEPDDLAEVRLPCLLHWHMNHFVVLVRYGRKRCVVHDPAMGRIVVSRADVDAAFTGIALEAWPSPSFEKQDRRQIMKLGSVIPGRQGLVGALVRLAILALGIEACTLLLPILQQFVIDDALVAGDRDLLVVLTTATAVFLAGQAATAAVRGIAQRNLSSTLSVAVPSHVFRHLLSLPTHWFERRSAADVLNRFDSANEIHRTLTTSLVTAGIDGLVAILAIGAMLLYSPRLTAIVLAAFAGYALIRTLSYRVYRHRSQGQLVQNAKLQALQWETLRGAATIKLVNGLAARRAQYVAQLSRVVRLKNQLATTTTLFGFGHDLAFAAERVAVLYLGADAVLARDFSIGMLVAFLSFREHFVSKGTSLISTAFEFRLLGIHTDRLSDILLTSPEHEPELPYLGEVRADGRLAVEGVTYRYGDNERDVLKNCNLMVEPGEVVAIVGPSGTGKSTLLKLLTGQLVPRDGEILLDGVPLQSHGLRRLRDVIGVVRQDDMLFSGTIAENIAFLAEEPDHKQIREAARLAQINDEIDRMPMGYNTLVGSMGTGLSGGQLQRIMLARALYRKPKILLMDEATSHLDIANERALVTALSGLSITQIIIAHRPETIARATRVVDIRDLCGGGRDGVIALDPRRPSRGD